MKSVNIFIPSEWTSAKSQADNYLKADGSNSFTANLNANGYSIENVREPTFENDTVNKGWIEKYFLKIKDDGTVDAKNARLTNLHPPASVNDAVTKTDTLFCAGKVFLVREKRLLFDKVYSSMTEIGENMTFTQNIIAKVELWLRLDENKATTFTVDFCKNRDIIFSKYYSYNAINLESSSEFCSFIEPFSKTDKFAINVAADMSTVISYHLNISSIKSS